MLNHGKPDETWVPVPNMEKIKKNKVIKLLLIHVFYEQNNLTDNIAHFN